jgi:SEC-C motif
MASQPGRNDPCPCGSGAKYKKCCLEKDEAARTAAAATNAAAVAAAAAAAPPVAHELPTAKPRVQPKGVSNRAPPPARRRSV